MNYTDYYIASQNKHNIKKYLSEDDPSTDDNQDIRIASIWGHLEVIKALLKDPRVDPSAKNNQAIREASEFGYLEIVELLLADPRVDPTANDNEAIKAAHSEGHTEIVELLKKHGCKL